MKIGADPEYLFTNADGEFKSVIGHMPGSKEKPHPVACGSIHPDNVAGEINVDPASSPEELSHNINTVKAALGRFLPFQFSEKHAAVFSPGELAHPDAMLAGCDPDFNIYLDAINEIPPLEMSVIRCAGGHVHIGDIGKADLAKLIRALDFKVGIPLVLHDQPFRRSLYGHAGSYRPKPYGVEYRTPSNFWTLQTERIHWMFHTVREVLSEFETMKIPENVRMIIDNHETDAAERMISKHCLAMVPV